jgi:glycosyltransferase involved in cell wall biosynthesis
MSAAHYVIITPARNEGQYLQKTIDSVVTQTLTPQKWVIVSDGSTDNTSQLIDSATKQYAWIHAVHRRDRGFRRSGGGVIEAFYDGYRFVEDEPWDYLVKLDGDLSFASTYFEACFQEFEKNHALGIGGGTICVMTDGNLRVESKGDPPFHVRGATKIYRHACWNAIGGLLREAGWDTLDEVKANMLGWRTRTFHELQLVQHRETGAADGTWKNWVKNGRANYVVGYHPLFMLCKCAQRLFERPYGVVSAGLWFGFLSGYFQRISRVKDPALIKYLRQQQLRRLTLRSSLWGTH